MKLKFLFSFLLTISVVYPQNKDIPGLSSISIKDLMKTVNYLSSKELSGRLSGSEGYNKAAYFIVNEFKMLGLKPLGDDEYLQKFDVEYNEIISPIKLALISEENNKKEFKLGKDFICRGFTGSNHITAPIAYCGYGISNPDLGYDDYNGIDVSGKVVMCFKPSPSWQIKNPSDWKDESIRTKIATAASHGAIGILFVSLPNDKHPQKPLLSILEGEGKQNKTFPSMHIDIATAEEFLSGTGYSLKSLQTTIDSTHKPFSLNMKTQAELEVTANYTKKKETMNIVGLLEGSDETLKDEYLIVGAHLDHVGSQGDIYAPGANDNASGSSAVLEIAKTFIANKVKPKRSIIFVLFASEEIGMAGSKYFVDNSPVSLKKITAMINFDCIGFGDSIQVGNGKSAPNLWKLIASADSGYTKQMVKNTWSNGGADASAFHEEGIPCAYFVSTNSYEHLHCITDTPQTLNKDLFEKIVKLAYITIFNVANGNYTREPVK